MIDVSPVSLFHAITRETKWVEAFQRAPVKKISMKCNLICKLRSVVERTKPAGAIKVNRHSFHTIKHDDKNGCALISTNIMNLNRRVLLYLLMLLFSH